MHVYIKGFVRKCSRKMNKGIQAYVEKYSIMIAKLILLLSVASVMRKLLKTTHPEECSVHKNSESCNIQLGSESNQFNSKQIIHILQPIVIDYFTRHSYIFYI